MSSLVITPKTKIYDLLEAYPQLEDVLIFKAPQFKKLKNPILRKTITKITTLSQAATIASLNVEELVNSLRSEIGQTEVTLSENSTSYNVEQPEWFIEEAISQTIDVRDMLHAGEQPIHEVLTNLKKLHNREILKIIAPFIPAPLIDKSIGLGYKHWLVKEKEELIFIYFSK